MLSGLHEAIGQATENGHLNSGRIGIVVATVFAKEAYARAALIADCLRQARASCAPAQIAALHEEIRNTVCDLFKTNLSDAVALSEQIGTIKNR